MESNPTSTSVRVANREDIACVWALVLELAEYERLSHTVIGTAELLERHTFDDNLIEVFVAESDGEIVGYSISFRSFSTFRAQPGIWLEDLYVTPEERGKGHGKALLQNLIDLCRTRGYGRLEWSVLDWNEPSIRFYEAMGAQILDDWKICRMVVGG